jgi:hypothetical protein
MHEATPTAPLPARTAETGRGVACSVFPSTSDQPSLLNAEHKQPLPAAHAAPRSQTRRSPRPSTLAQPASSPAWPDPDPRPTTGKSAFELRLTQIRESVTSLGDGGDIQTFASMGAERTEGRQSASLNHGLTRSDLYALAVFGVTALLWRQEPDECQRRVKTDPVALEPKRSQGVSFQPLLTPQSTNATEPCVVCSLVRVPFAAAAVAFPRCFEPRGSVTSKLSP